MNEFLMAASGFVLATVGLGLVRILRGPGDAERMMAAQLLGTGGIAALLLAGAATGASATADVLTITAVSAGAFFFLAGTVGLLRFPDTLTRLHALTKADTLGLGLVVLGLLPRAPSPTGALKLVSIWLLVLLAGATVSQLIARAARREAA